MVCVGLMFGNKNMQFHIICSLYYSISINASEVDPPSDSLHNGIVKPMQEYGIFSRQIPCILLCSEERFLPYLRAPRRGFSKNHYPIKDTIRSSYNRSSFFPSRMEKLSSERGIPNSTCKFWVSNSYVP